MDFTKVSQFSLLMTILIFMANAELINNGSKTTGHSKVLTRQTRGMPIGYGYLGYSPPLPPTNNVQNYPSYAANYYGSYPYSSPYPYAGSLWG